MPHLSDLNRHDQVTIAIDTAKLPAGGTYRAEFGCTTRADFDAHCEGSRNYYARAAGSGELCLVPAQEVSARWVGTGYPVGGQRLPSGYYIYAHFPSGSAPRELPKFGASPASRTERVIELPEQLSSLGHQRGSQYNRDVRILKYGPATQLSSAFDRLMQLGLHACDQCAILNWVAKSGAPGLQKHMADFVLHASKGNNAWCSEPRYSLNNLQTHSVLFDMLGTSVESARIAALEAAREWGSDYFNEGFKLNLAEIGERDRSAAVRSSAAALKGSLNLDNAREVLKIWRTMASKNT